MPKRIPLLLALASLVIIGAACSDTGALEEQVMALEAQVAELDAKVKRLQERPAALEAGSSFDAETEIARLDEAYANLNLEYDAHRHGRYFWVDDDIVTDSVFKNTGEEADSFFDSGAAFGRISLAVAMMLHRGESTTVELPVIRCREWLLGMFNKEVEMSDCGMAPVTD